MDSKQNKGADKMGTRGAMGFRKDGIDKVTYNHFDSYPSYLGKALIEFCQKHTIDEMEKMFNKIKLVDEDEEPTQEQIEVCLEYYDRQYGSLPGDWYCLLRKGQGDLNCNVKTGYMIDSAAFLIDSLSCEYAYIINLDTKMLEIYKGFSKSPGKGRYANFKDDQESEYYGVNLVNEIPLSEIKGKTWEDMIPGEEE